MKPQSRKAKGRLLQQWIRDKLLETFPELTDKDIRSTSMGAQGEDIQLSEAGFKHFPFYVEAKSRERFSIYQHYEQSKTDSNVLLVIKGNRKRPLAVVDAELFIKIIRKLNGTQTDL